MVFSAGDVPGHQESPSAQGHVSVSVPSQLSVPVGRGFRIFHLEDLQPASSIGGAAPCTGLLGGALLLGPKSQVALFCSTPSPSCRNPAAPGSWDRLAVIECVPRHVPAVQVGGVQTLLTAPAPHGATM